MDGDEQIEAIEERIGRALTLQLKCLRRSRQARQPAERDIARHSLAALQPLLVELSEMRCNAIVAQEAGTNGLPTSAGDVERKAASRLN